MSQRVARLLSRTIDKLASRFLRVRHGQVLTLQAGPIAEGAATVQELVEQIKATPEEAPAIRPILATTTTEDQPYPVRRYAIEALLKVFEATPGQAPAIIQTLEDAVKDRDEWVGSSAREALAKMIKAVPCEAAAIIHRLEDAVKDR